MPARDKHHDLVVKSLKKEGWIITHDPYRITVGKTNLFVDLGAEKLLAAEKGNKRIAIEIKSFIGESEIHQLEEALGQFFLYKPFLHLQEPGRDLYLAIPSYIHENIFQEPIGEGLLSTYQIPLIVYSEATEVIITWIPAP